MEDNRRHLVISPAGPWHDEQLKISPEIHRALVYHGWMPPGGPECTEGAPNLDIAGIPDPHAGCPCVLKLGHDSDANSIRHKCAHGTWWPLAELPARFRRPPVGPYLVDGVGDPNDHPDFPKGI